MHTQIPINFKVTESLNVQSCNLINYFSAKVLIALHEIETPGCLHTE